MKRRGGGGHARVSLVYEHVYLSNTYQLTSPIYVCTLYVFYVHIS